MYKCTFKGDNKTYALKEVSKARLLKGKNNVEMIMNEANILKSFVHPFLV